MANTLEMSLTLETMPAETGFAYADFIRRIGISVIKGHVQRVSKAIKASVPTRKPSERKYKGGRGRTRGEWHDQYKDYRTLKTGIRAKNIKTPRNAMTFARVAVTRGKAYWYNFLQHHSVINRSGRGSLNPVPDFVRPNVERFENQLVSEINEASKRALNLAIQYTKPVIAEYTRNKAQSFKGMSGSVIGRRGY